MVFVRPTQFFLDLCVCAHMCSFSGTDYWYRWIRTKQRYKPGNKQVSSCITHIDAMCIYIMLRGKWESSYLWNLVTGSGQCWCQWLRINSLLGCVHFGSFSPLENICGSNINSGRIPNSMFIITTMLFTIIAIIVVMLYAVVYMIRW